MRNSGAGFLDRFGRNLGSLSLEKGQLGAVSEEARRARFVHLDMRDLVAQDRAMRRTKRGEAEAIGRGSRRHPKGAHRRAEQIGKGPVEPLRPMVAIISGIDPIYRAQRLNHLRTYRGGVVGEKAHQLAHDHAKVLTSIGV